ncbi:MAG: glutaredoxin 3 [Sphingomonadales bacterium]
MTEVTIYTTMMCPYCVRAKALLKGKGTKFREIGVGMSPSKRAEMRNLAGGRNSVPQIFIGGRHIGGCDELHALDAAGKLDQLLTPA